ncbi:MAG TPA: nicotinamide riboside transporter PnuC [Rhodanobacteraceae bacterium]
MVWVELVAAVLSAIAVWLSTIRSLWCQPIGLVSVILYAWVFVSARLYSDVLLQFLNVIMLVYGWLYWRQHLGDDRRVTVAALAPRLATFHVVLGILGALVLGYAMRHWTNAALPWLDATLTSFSMVAAWWQDRRHIAAWWLWIPVNTVYVGEFLYKDLAITSALYAGFVLLSIIGLRGWQRAGKEQAMPGPQPPAPDATVVAPPPAHATDALGKAAK